MHRTLLLTGALFAALAVIIGAFGAHGLRGLVNDASLATFETGVRYHFYHSLGLLAAGVLYDRFKSKWVLISGFAFVIGIFLFSGSLYLMTILKITGDVGLRGLGIITPFGGLLFVAGWISMMMAIGQRPPASIRSN